MITNSDWDKVHNKPDDFNKYFANKVIVSIITWYNYTENGYDAIQFAMGTRPAYMQFIERAMVDITGESSVENAIRKLIESRPEDHYTNEIPGLMHAILRDIRQKIDSRSKDLRTESGLCLQLIPNKIFEEYCEFKCVYDTSSILHRGFRMLQYGWPEYSGNPRYPVPSTDPKKNEVEAYTASRNKYEGEYGAARIRLLDYLIGLLEGKETPVDKPIP